MDKIALKEFFQKKYESPSAFLENVIFPVFGEENYDSSGNYHWLHKHPEDQTAADNAGIVDILVLGSLYVEGSQLDLFDITVSSKRQLANSRVGIQQLVRRIISSHSGAFMIFHYQTTERWDWRFTFCHKGANQIDSSDTKRYTFLLGPGQSCRTAAENFFKLGEKISGSGEFEMEDIIRAFDVEALSKEFFAKYKVHYERFCQFVYDNKDNREYFGPEFSVWEDKIIRDYVKKLLGRIVFLHFLQKKGWLGVPAGGQWGDGDPQFMKHLFEASRDEQKQNYLDTVLEPLFSGALNVQRENDVFNLNVPGYTDIRIPYLNGGLFERDELDEPASAFPAEYFADLFEFFYQYNFTIDENDPDDAEVGIDPEMLGRIFENLLEDNKDKGAYYTPKEIVQYMCRESLIAYLTTCFMERNGSFTRDRVETEVRRLVKDPETKVPEMNQRAKDDFGNDLRKVRICDPAIGSGAFPMGLLNELVRCRVAIDAWAKDDAGRLLTGDYAALKREIINNNIYGVDIERGAIDIARLRFWLSIVVDEQEPQPLPNLDYKFMQGNSLITTFNGEYINLDTKSQQHTRVEDMKREKARLYGLKQKYYTANGESKYQFDVEIKDSILSLISMQLGYEIRTWYDKNAEQLALFPDDSPKQLSFADIKEQLPAEKQKILDLGATLRRQLSDSSKPLAVRAQTDIRFFDWRIMFTEVFEGENPGFDIVIGNPPYISAPAQVANEALLKQRNDIIKSKLYSSLYQKWDLYIPFIEHGIQLLCQDGITSMIVPFPLTNQTYGKRLRELIMKDYTIYELSDLNGTKIFENATVSNCIPFIRKTNVNDATVCISHIDGQRIIHREYTKTYSDFMPDEGTAVWNTDNEQRDVNRHAGMHVLGDYCYISVGMVINADENTAKGEFKKEDLISLTEDEIHCRKYIEAKDIEKYKVCRVRYLEYDTERCPNKLRRPTFRELYEFPRLVMNCLGTINATIDERDNYLHNHSIYCAVPWYSLKTVQNKSISASIKRYSNLDRSEMEKLSEQLNIKYLLAIMNSRYADVLLTNLRAGDYHIYPEHIRNIPVAPASAECQQSLITIVDRILSAKRSDPQADTSAMENEIDNIVYHLYSLTYEEVLVIDPDTPITRQEYDNC